MKRRRQSLCARGGRFVSLRRAPRVALGLLLVVTMLWWMPSWALGEAETNVDSGEAVADGAPPAEEASPAEGAPPADVAPFPDVPPVGDVPPAEAPVADAATSHNVPCKIGWQNPPTYPQVSARSVVLPGYATGYHTYVTPSRIAPNATREQCIDAFVERAYEYLGTPYQEPWSREPGVGIDCSGLVLQCLYATGMDLEYARGTKQLGGYNPYNHFWVPEQCFNSMRWLENGTFMPVSLYDIRRGDLVFYDGHVAIYVGDNQILHSAGGQGVVLSSLFIAWPIGVERPFV